MEERPTLISPGFDPQTSLEERFDCLRMPSIESRFERVDTRSAAGVRVGAGRDQGPGRFGLAGRGRPVEGRESVRVRRFNVGPVGQEENNQFAVSAVACEMEGSPAAFVFFVDRLGIFGDEGLDLGQIARPDGGVDGAG